MKNVVFLLLVSISSICFSQELIGKVALETNRILIRWAVVDSAVFKKTLRSGFILERAEEDSLFLIHSNIKQFLIFPDSSLHPDWERLAKVDPKVLYVHQLFFTNKPFPKTLLHLAAASADQNFELACSMGWGFIDSTMVKGRKYTYRIRISGMEKFFLLKNATEISVISSFGIKQINKKLLIKWNVERNRTSISGYILEKREVGKTFSAVSLCPIVELRNLQVPDSLLYFEDTLVQHEIRYEFRICGIDHFGRVGEWSALASITYFDPVEGEIRITGAEIKDNQLELKCVLPNAQELTYFKSNRIKGPYEALFFSDGKSPIFLTPAPKASCYFKVCAKGRGGDSICSLPFYFFIPDTIPPDCPTGLKSMVTEKGIVDLSWDKGNDSSLLGFRLFRSNSYREEFVEINKQLLTESAYTDTLNLQSLSPKVFYYVIALDELYNNSRSSDTICVSRPDTIPPMIPVISSLDANKDRIILTGFVDRIMQDSIFLECRSERLKKRIYLTSDSGKIRVVDSTFAPGIYIISLSAFDKAGNHSSSLTRKFTIPERTSVILYSDSIFVDRKEKLIRLKWKQQKDVWNVVLYRSKNDGSLTPLNTLPGSATEYVDRQLYMGNVYHYQWMFLFKDGTKILSTPMSITY